MTVNQATNCKVNCTLCMHKNGNDRHFFLLAEETVTISFKFIVIYHTYCRRMWQTYHLCYSAYFWAKPIRGISLDVFHWSLSWLTPCVHVSQIISNQFIFSQCMCLGELFRFSLWWSHLCMHLYNNQKNAKSL